MSEHQESAGRPEGIGMRTMEIVVALVLLGLGLLVIYDSRRLGAGWSDNGPEAGYFPFYVGLLMSLASVVTLVQTLFGRTGKAEAQQIFVEWKPLRQVLSVLVPALVYVAGIQAIGIYVSSAIYIAGFMMWLGRYTWLRSIVVGVAVSAAAFMTFEVWFQVPLYKGIFNPLFFLGY